MGINLLVREAVLYKLKNKKLKRISTMWNPGLMSTLNEETV